MDGMLAQLKRLESAPALAKQRFHFRRIFTKAVPQEHTQPQQLLRRAAVPQILHIRPRLVVGGADNTYSAPGADSFQQEEPD